MGAGSLGDVFFSIFADDKTKEGLDSARTNWVTTTGDILNAIDKVSGAIEGMAKEHANVAASSERVSIISGLEADKIEALSNKYMNVHNSMADNLQLEEKLGKVKGITIEQMDRMIPLWQEFGEANGEQAATLMGKLSPAWKQFGITLEEQPAYFDKLTYVFAKTSIDADTFATQINKTGPTLSQMGLSLDQAGGLLLTMASHGETGRVAMTKLSKAIKEADDAGLSGSEAFDYIAKAIGYSSEEANKNVTAMGSATGITEKLAKAEDLSATQGERLGTELKKDTFFLTGFTSELEPVTSSLGAVAQGGIGLYAVLSMFPGLAGTIGGAFSGIAGTISGSLGGLTGIASSAAVGIGGAVVAGIAIGFAGVWALDKAGILTGLSNLGADIQKSPMGKGVMDALKVVLSPIGSLGAGIIDIVRGDFDKIGPDMMEPFNQAGGVIAERMAGMVSSIEGGGSSIQGGIASIVSGFQDLETGAYNLGSSFGSAVSGVIAGASEIFGGIGAAFGGMAGQVQGVFSTIMTAIQNLISSSFDGFVSLGYNIIISLVNGIISAGAAVLTAFQNIFASISSFFGGLTGGGGARASGGPVSEGTPYLVGERGPEMFIPSSPGGIVPNSALPAGGGGGGGDTITISPGAITINGAGSNAQEIAGEVISMFEDYLAQKRSARGYRT